MRVALLASLLGSAVAFAAPPAPIGVVTASGHFTLEGSSIWGNSTLFDGARVETREASSQLALRNGVKVQLAANSAARIWQDHLVLERGAGQVTSTNAFEASAAGMKVAGQRYQLGLGERLEVASLTGNARVLNAKGGVLATIPAGRNMSFALYQGVTMVGCLLYKDGGFILPVQDSDVVAQLVGPDLAANVGNQVEAMGTASNNAPTVSPATRVVNVTSIAPRSTGGCLTTAAAYNASATMPTNAPASAAAKAKPVPGASGQAPRPPVNDGGGMSTGAKVAIAAVIIGGGAGGAIVALGKKDSTSQ